MAASWKELFTLVITIFLITTINSSTDAIDAEQKVVTVDETELDDDVGTDAADHPPVVDAKAPAAAGGGGEQERVDVPLTREPEPADETEIGTEAEETATDGSKVEDRSDDVSSKTPVPGKVEVVGEGIAPHSEAHPLDAARVDHTHQEGVPSESIVQRPVVADIPRLSVVQVQPDSKSLGDERRDEGLAAEVGTGKAVAEADPTEADEDETEVTGSIVVDKSEGEQLQATSVKQQSRNIDATEESKPTESHTETVESGKNTEGLLLKEPVEKAMEMKIHVEPLILKEPVEIVAETKIHVEPLIFKEPEGTSETHVTDRRTEETPNVSQTFREPPVSTEPKEKEAVERPIQMEETPVVDRRTEETPNDSQKFREPPVSSEPKEKEAVEKPVQIEEQQQRLDENQLKETEHRPTSFGSQSESADEAFRSLEKTETNIEPEKTTTTTESVTPGDAGTAKETPREDGENISVTAKADGGSIHSVVVSETPDAANESATDQEIPQVATETERKQDVVKDDAGGQAVPPGHTVSLDTIASEHGKAEHESQPPSDRLADLEKDRMDHGEDGKRDFATTDADLKLDEKLLAHDHLESGESRHSGFFHPSGSGPALRSLLSEKLPMEELLSKTPDEQPASEPGELVVERLEQPFADNVDREQVEPLSFEGEKEPGTEESSNDLPADDNSSLVSRFLTLRPYVILSEHALSVLDPWLEGIVKNFPPEMQTFFLKAPFALTPSRALLLFIASCISLVIVSSCACRQSGRQKSRQFEKQSILEQLSSVQAALLIAEQEKETATKELDSLKDQLQGYEHRSTLSSDEAGHLSSQVQSLTSERDALQQKVAQQLDTISDLSATVSSQLQSNSSTASKNKSVQKKLEETTTHAGMLESQLYELQTTLQQSQGSALEMQSQLQSMTEEIAILQTSKDQLLLEAEGWNEKVQEQADQISKLRDEEKTHQEAISLRDKEISVLRECYQQLKLFESSLDSANATNEEGDGEDEDEEERKKRLKEEVQKKIKSMIDVAQVNAKLNATEEERNSLKHTLSMEMESRMELEDQVKVMKAKMEKVMESRQEAEQQATRTALKMDVLVNYFKEKETDLNRKLGEQAARERASVDQLVNTDERTKEFEKMVHLYKEQVEDLQKEIQSIEADYRKQIALQEKKAHENWLVARQSEREVKEYKIESQMLRHKILELQNKLEAATAEIKTGQEMVQTAPGIGLANGMPPVDDRPMSRPLLQPPFGPPPFVPGPFLPHDRPLPPPLYPHMPPLPPMMFDRRAQEMRSPPPFDVWPPPSHMRRSPMPPRDRSPPRNRSPSPPSQRGRMSPTSLRGGRYSPPRGGRSPPPVIGERQSTHFAGPRGPHPGGNPRQTRPSYNRSGTDQRPGPRLPPHLQRSDFHVSSSGQRSSTPDC